MPGFNPFSFKPDIEAALDDVGRFRQYARQQLGRGLRRTMGAGGELLGGVEAAGREALSDADRFRAYATGRLAQGAREAGDLLGSPLGRVRAEARRTARELREAPLDPRTYLRGAGRQARLMAEGTGGLVSPVLEGLQDIGTVAAEAGAGSVEFLIPGRERVFPINQEELARRRQTRDTLLGRLPLIGPTIEEAADKFASRRQPFPGAKFGLELIASGGEAGAAKAAPSLLSRAAPRAARFLEGPVTGRVFGPGLLGAGLGSMAPAESEQERLRNIGLGFAAGLAAPEALRLVPYARSLRPSSGLRSPRMSMAAGEFIPRQRVTLRVRDLKTRPELFQARDVDPGVPFQERRVRQIVREFDPNLFEPPTVVRDPDTGEYVIVRGHHRTEAWRRVYGDDAEIPVDVAQADLRDPRQLEQLQVEADVSNFMTAQPNFGETVRVIQRLEATGRTPEQIADLMRKTVGDLDQYRDAARLGQPVVERVTVEPALGPIAAELGRGMRLYGVRQDEAVAWFNRIAQSTDMPTQTALRATVDKFGRKLAEIPPQMFEGFGELEGGTRSALISLLDQHAAVVRDIRNQRSAVSRLINQLESLRKNPRATAAQVAAMDETLAFARQELRQLEEALQQNELDLSGTLREMAEQGRRAPQAEPARPPEAPQTMTDLFGEERPIPRPGLEEPPVETPPTVPPGQAALFGMGEPPTTGPSVPTTPPPGTPRPPLELRAPGGQPPATPPRIPTEPPPGPPRPELELRPPGGRPVQGPGPQVPTEPPPGPPRPPLSLGPPLSPPRRDPRGLAALRRGVTEAMTRPSPERTDLPTVMRPGIQEDLLRQLSEGVRQAVTRTGPPESRAIVLPAPEPLRAIAADNPRQMATATRIALQKLADLEPKGVATGRARAAGERLAAEAADPTRYTALEALDSETIRTAIRVLGPGQDAEHFLTLLAGVRTPAHAVDLGMKLPGPFGAAVRFVTGRTVRDPNALGASMAWERALETGTVRVLQKRMMWQAAAREVGLEDGLGHLYIGEALADDNPARKIIGTLADIVEHPEDYDLTAAQRDMIRLWQETADNDLALTRKAGIDAREWSETYYVPHVLSRETRPIVASGAATRRPGTRPFFVKEREAPDLRSILRANPDVEVVTDFATLMDKRLMAGVKARADKALLDRLREMGRPVSQVRVGRERGLVAGPEGLQDHVFDPELAPQVRAVVDLMTRRREAPRVETVLEGLRELVLSMDLSGAFGVHGRLFLYSNPAELRGWATRTVAFMTDDESFRVWFLTNADDVQEMVQRGGLRIGVSPVDLERVGGRYALELLPGKLGKLGKGVRVLNERQFERVVTWHKVQSYKLWYEALRKARDDRGVYRILNAIPGFKRYLVGVEGKTDDELHRIVGEIVNHRFGGLSQAAQGKTPARNLIEKLLDVTLGFLRARAGLYINALTKGGPEGFLARKLVLQEFLIATALAEASKYLVTGEHLDWSDVDPRAGGSFSLYTPWGKIPLIPSLSVMRFVARVVGGRGDLGSLGEELSERFGVSRRSALGSFASSRTSPAARLVVDQLTGTDYAGRPLDSVQDRLVAAAQAVLPASVQEVGRIGQEAARGEPVSAPGAGLRIGAQLLGGQMYPPSRTDRLDAAARERYGRPFSDLTPDEAVQIAKGLGSDPNALLVIYDNADQQVFRQLRAQGYFQDADSIQEWREREVRRLRKTYGIPEWQAENLAEGKPEYRAYQRRAAAMRLLLRRANPELDELLLERGRVEQPASETRTRARRTENPLLLQGRGRRRRSRVMA